MNDMSKHEKKFLHIRKDFLIILLGVIIVIGFIIGVVHRLNYLNDQYESVCKIREMVMVHYTIDGGKITCAKSITTIPTSWDRSNDKIYDNEYGERGDDGIYRK